MLRKGHEKYCLAGGSKVTKDLRSKDYREPNTKYIIYIPFVTSYTLVNETHIA